MTAGLSAILSVSKSRMGADRGFRKARLRANGVFQPELRRKDLTDQRLDNIILAKGARIFKRLYSSRQNGTTVLLLGRAC